MNSLARSFQDGQSLVAVELPSKKKKFHFLDLLIINDDKISLLGDGALVVVRKQIPMVLQDERH